MIYLVMFALTHVCISLYLEKRKFSLATVTHAVSFALLLMVSLLIHANGFIVMLFERIDASAELIELIRYFADARAEDVSNVVFIFDIVTWILITLILALRAIEIICNIKIKLSSVLLFDDNHKDCVKISVNKQVYNTNSQHLMVMRC